MIKIDFLFPWWRHQIKIFSALLALCAGNSPVTGEFPAERPVTRGFYVFFVLRLDKRLSKQWWGWWYETVSRPLWRHSNVQIHPCGVSPIMITSWHGNNFRHLWGEFAGRWWIPLIIGRYGGRLMFSTTCCTTSLVSCWWLEILWCSCDVTVMITKI